MFYYIPWESSYYNSSLAVHVCARIQSIVTGYEMERLTDLIIYYRGGDDFTGLSVFSEFFVGAVESKTCPMQVFALVSF